MRVFESFWPAPGQLGVTDVPLGVWNLRKLSIPYIRKTLLKVTGPKGPSKLPSI